MHDAYAPPVGELATRILAARKAARENVPFVPGSSAPAAKLRHLPRRPPHRSSRDRPTAAASRRGPTALPNHTGAYRANTTETNAGLTSKLLHIRYPDGLQRI
jgi:hypothetical protein